MTHLLAKTGSLSHGDFIYAKRKLLYITFPTVCTGIPSGTFDYSTYSRSGFWKSADYYPTPFPGPYSGSYAASQAASNMNSKGWTDYGATLWAEAKWGGRTASGTSYTNASVRHACRVWNTTRYAGFLATVEAHIGSTVTAAGAGSRIVGISSLGSNSPGQYGDQELAIETTGWHTVATDMRLNKYIRLSTRIGGNSPPTNPNNYGGGWASVDVSPGGIRVTLTGV